MFKRGIVIGKFYPPHRGHKYLIDTALSQCEEVTIIVCSLENEFISGDKRVRWLKEIHPNTKVVHAENTPLADDDSEGWAKFTTKLLGYIPDAVFTSEDYGDVYAKFLGAQHVSVDQERVRVPISGTKVRTNPLAHFEFLEPPVRRYFARRICVLGAESTGTTTLAEDLAQHYATAWVPEYGRLYSEGKLFADKTGAWQSSEFEHIARSQNALEENLAGYCSGLLICDTDAFATSVWHERYMGFRSPTVEQIAAVNHHALYILTGDEIPFVQDGTRDGEHIRHWMHQRFEERLKEDARPYVVVRGNEKERLDEALMAIDTFS